MSEVASAIAYLKSPLAIRTRCEQVLEAGLAGTLTLRPGGGPPIQIHSDGTVF